MAKELGWAKEMSKKFAAGVAHTFILHLNVSDLVKGKDGQYKSLKHYLTDELLAGWKIIVFYDRASGIHFLDGKSMREKFNKVVFSQVAPDEKKVDPAKGPELPKGPEEALPLLEKLLRVSPAEASKILGEKIESNFAVLIIGFAETIFPAGDITNQSVPDRVNIITMAQWARRTKIEESGNLVIMLTHNLAEMSPLLRDADSNVESVKISLPDLEQRRNFIEALPTIMISKKTTFKTEFRFDEGENIINALAGASAGLTKNSIRDLAAQAMFQNIPFSVDFIWERKSQILEQSSGGLIEVVRPLDGFEVIGGLHDIKDYFRFVGKAVKAGDILSVPQGILMLGPPGTGKTVMAIAFAYEIGFNLVKLKNLREMWVGQSERNQDKAYEIIEAQAPVVVFEDEVDQQEVARGTGFSGDSGVSNRMMARKMEFMSDTNHRGRIVWLAATNRPDLMDQAMIREGRFDDKIIFCIPDAAGRFEIFKAIFTKLIRCAARYGQELGFEISDTELKAISDPLEDYTGAEIEVICNRSCRFARERVGARGRGKIVVTAADLRNSAEDFVVSRDNADYKTMTAMALAKANSLRMVPSHFRETVKKRKTTKP